MIYIRDNNINPVKWPEYFDGDPGISDYSRGNPAGIADNNLTYV